MNARVRRLALLLVLLAVIVGSWLIVERARESGEAVEAVLRAERARDLEMRRKVTWGRYDERGHERLGPPREGEWLWVYPEHGQTADEYKLACKNRRSPGRETITLRPLGPLSPRAKAVMEPVRRFCETFFTAPARVVEERPLPEEAFRSSRQQHDVGPLLASLQKELEDPDLVRAGLADRDLCWEGQVQNYVFGGASLENRVGVYSFERFARGAVAEPLYRHRCFGVVAHELGHILGLHHCIYYRCVMQGANSLPEIDAAPLRLCPVCEEKLAWNLGFEPKARLVALARLYREEGLEAEARWAQERAQDRR